MKIEPHTLPRRRRAWTLARRVCLAAVLAGAAWPALAQLRLPPLNLPGNLSNLPLPTQPLPALQQQSRPLQELRASTARELLRRNPGTLEADPAGEPVRRRELVLVSPSPAVVDAARALGFAVLREQALPELDLRQLV